AAESAGALVSAQLGFSFAQMVNPMTHEEAAPLGQLATVVTGLLFFTVGGHHVVLRALAGSFQALPAGTLSVSSAWTGLLLDRAGEMLLAAVHIAAPLGLAVLAGQLTF